MEFRLADIGEGMQEAEVLRWMVQDGDAVQEDQPLIEIQTDKVTVELPSPWRGRVVRRFVQEGDMVTVGAALLEIATDGEQEQRQPAMSAQSASQPADRAPADGSTQSIAAAAPDLGHRVLAAPATRKRALELGIDLRDVPGTGPAGRVTPQDLASYAAGARPVLTPPPATPKLHPKDPEDERRPLRGLRRVIAKNMATAHREIPQAAHLDDCDITGLSALRARWNALLVQNGEDRLTYLPFAVKAACAALRLHPDLAAHFDGEREEIVLSRRLHIGIATDAPDGLLVPVVHDADRLPLRELAKEVRRLAQAARDRSLQQADTEGGAFTITNHGSIGGLYGLPIIRYPEVAILGLGRIRDEPVVRNGNIVVRTILHFSIAFDHRALDGGEIARFAQDFRRFLEDPDQLLMEMA
ncbi:MAG: dihydrolipoamide acetyltransferase family protein [Thermaerobacter sp.]|nr:dihydrolipoamide acetyltransferase family protein [Thermaerobacter sp.]